MCLGRSSCYDLPTVAQCEPFPSRWSVTPLASYPSIKATRLTMVSPHRRTFSRRALIQLVLAGITGLLITYFPDQALAWLQPARIVVAQATTATPAAVPQLEATPD